MTEANATVYVVIYDADYGCDGRTTTLMGVFDTPEGALGVVQKDHEEKNLTGLGLSDYNISPVPLNKAVDIRPNWGLEDRLELTLDGKEDSRWGTVVRFASPELSGKEPAWFAPYRVPLTTIKGLSRYAGAGLSYRVHAKITSLADVPVYVEVMIGTAVDLPVVVPPKEILEFDLTHTVWEGDKLSYRSSSPDVRVELRAGPHIVTASPTRRELRRDR